jgi:hypothetical protein
MRHKLNSDQTTDTIQKFKMHVFKLLTASTFCGENCESSWVQVGL